jgi:hypothetical protein
MADKESRHFRLSTETRRLLDLLGAKLGIKHTALVELAIRRLAEQEQVRRADDDYRDPDQQRP